ncbi:MAG: PilZ domain-containing protein [Nocardioides sp.]|nr:PilZ domain-containing protein [Nocardioides sp.]
MTATLVAALVALTCYTAWTELAGRQLRLIDRTASSTWPNLGIRDLRADHTADSAIRQPKRPGDTADARVTDSPAPVPATGGQPRSLDGTTVALIVNLAVIGLGALIQQAILRRLRQGNHARREGQRELISPAEVEDQGADSQEVASDHGAEPDHEMDQDLAHDPDERGDDESTAPIDPDDAVPTARTRRTPAAPTTVPLADPADRVDHTPVTAGAVRVATRRDTAAAADTRPGTSGSSTYDFGDLEIASARSVVYDRRERLRISYKGRARLQWEGHDLACETVNLDINGVRCTFPSQGEAALAPATPVRITLMLDGVLLPTAARVTSSGAEGDQWRVGLRFESLDDHYREILLSFLHEQDRMN